MTAWRIVGAALLALLPAADGWACTKSVRWFDDPPYTFRDKDGNVAGLDADLAREALRRAGCKVRFVHMPWARALIELERGKLDILPGAFRSPERERFAWFSVPLPQSANILYLSKGAADKYNPATLGELAGTAFRLGAQMGVTYGDQFEQFKSNPAARANLVPVTLRCSAWQMLALGRIDGLIADGASAGVELRQLGLEAVVQPSKVILSTQKATFALSKASISPEFLDRFDRALSGLVSAGEYRKLRAHYWAEGTDPAACAAQLSR